MVRLTELAKMMCAFHGFEVVVDVAEHEVEVVAHMWMSCATVDGVIEDVPPCTR